MDKLRLSSLSSAYTYPIAKNNQVYFYFRMEVSQLYSTSVQRDELRGRVPIKALRILEASSQNCEYRQKLIAESVNASISMCARYFQDMRSKQSKRQRKGQLRIENGTKS